MSRRRRQGRALSGLLLIDKPLGLTSFDVVARLRRALNVSKVGHTGTLDPAATGLLPICLGDATRLVPYLVDSHKVYEGTLTLGVATNTYDAEGEITARADASGVGAEAVAAALPGFLGAITQRPPAFSAIKVKGERLYAKARAGEIVEAPLRTVQIDALALIEATPPHFRLRIACGKGTYIRSLAVDLGAALGLPAHLSALRRVEVAGHHVDAALSLEASPEALEAAVIDPAQAISHLPCLPVTAKQRRDIGVGRPIAAPEQPQGLYRALDEAGALLAILQIEAGVARVERGMPTG
ncbi:tRNA pseudouridine(55) synthase TruB [Myxococcota bacterium]|nr:tRNA pseudouridine(55) synthase TruB [Myxococcota bacterium]